ncbi:MAG: TMEM175 family protein [Bacteroidetes bacterium]|nr:TMEM175 family protein [Bacteroidota bacterium]
MFKRFQLWKINKHRTEAFSDGVFAIIVTLLVLEIKVPPLNDHTSSQELLDALVGLSPKIISWVASFFFISVMWVQHHNLFRMSEKIDYGMVWLNDIFLLFICFMPFPTALMGEYPHNRPAVLLFGLDVTIASLVQVWMYYYVAKNYLLSHYDQKNVMRNVKRSFMLAPMLLIVATAVSFVSLVLPYIIYLIVPFFFLLPFDEEKENL